MFRTAFLMGAALTLAQVSLAQTPTPAPAPAAAPAKPTLYVGDKAPALTIEKWVKGTPVAAFEKGKMYVVEFWATWCGPCIAGMPHLTELQKKYADKGLTVIGVSTASAPDAAETRLNTLDLVETMVKEKSTKGDIAYTIAWDKDSKTKDAWFKAAGKSGIPCAFLVDANGNIAYIGHPASIDDTLALVVDNKHDITKLAADYKKAADMKLDPTVRGGTAVPAGDSMTALHTELSQLVQRKDWVKLGTKIEAVATDKSFPEAPGMKFLAIAMGEKDMTKAYDYAKTIFESEFKDVPLALNDLAWYIVDPALKVEPKDLELAMKLAQQAVDLTKSKNGAIIDTLARVYFLKGDLEKAIELQTEAVKTEPRAKPALDEYKAALEKKKAGEGKGG